MINMTRYEYYTLDEHNLEYVKTHSEEYRFDGTDFMGAHVVYGNCNVEPAMGHLEISCEPGSIVEVEYTSAGSDISEWSGEIQVYDDNGQPVTCASYYRTYHEYNSDDVDDIVLDFTNMANNSVCYWARKHNNDAMKEAVSILHDYVEHTYDR